GHVGEHQLVEGGRILNHLAAGVVFSIPGSERQVLALALAGAGQAAAVKRNFQLQGNGSGGGVRRFETRLLEVGRCVRRVVGVGAHQIQRGGVTGTFYPVILLRCLGGEDGGLQRRVVRER